MDERRVLLADGRTRFVVTVMDDDDLDRRDVRRSFFLSTLADNEASILRPGGAAWDTLTVRHDGTRWTAEASAAFKVK